MQGRAHVAALQDAAEPGDLVGRLEEWVIAEYSRVLSLDDIVDFADRFAGDIPDMLDMLRDEQQPVRVNVPLLDEAACLLRAPARIALVHEAALVVHEAVQVSASASQALPEVFRRHFQDLGADGIADAENLAERENEALFAIQAKQHAHRTAVLGFFDQDRQFNWNVFQSGKSRS